jgi:prepilin-type N-terminal cleavage/methylation domain-containing protein
MRHGFCSLARLRRRGSQGFTLVELLTVVAIMGVLAAVAVTLVRHHLRSAKMTEGMAGVQAIRSAEAARRAETGTYLDCNGAGGAFFPSKPNAKVNAWQMSSHSDWAKWKQLRLPASEGTRFGWLVTAGLPDQALPTSTVLTASPTLPNQPDPWYVIQGVADSDGDLKYAKIVATSINNEVYTEDEAE